ncbi:hypothetical protein NT6N_23640 [Oceaniferula spumae]|uniref:Uncharacterized protein n=1 Tax=Oceaniferula spumae TaxID=2979115 RepID=A0AAT9FN42_9BACT
MAANLFYSARLSSTLDNDNENSDIEYPPYDYNFICMWHSLFPEE